MTFTNASSITVSQLYFFQTFSAAAHVHDRTANERPCCAMETPVSIADLHQTIYLCPGIPATHCQIEAHPFYITPDGKGAVVKNLLA